MASVEMSRDHARVMQLVILGLAEANRKCLNGLRRDTGHGAQHGARIETTTQEASNWHVADHPQLHRLVKLLAHDRSQFIDRSARPTANVRSPKSSRLDPAPLDDEGFAGPHLPNALEGR